MTHVIADRVVETSITTGTGALTLAGAVAGFRGFGAVCANADTAYYSAWGVDGNGIPTGEWETGLGTWGTGGILTRTSIKASSNAGLAVNFAAGTKRIALSEIAFSFANKQILPQNSQSIDYTLTLEDVGKHILHPSADTTARTFTIPANASVAFEIGTAITFVNQVSAGTVTIAITTDTMRLAGAGTTGSRTLVANGIATALKIAATQWIISGTGLS